jgi:acetyltransferase-like isoleucine patch superfamily enzyme
VGERAVIVAECGIDVGAEAVVGGWAAVLDAEPTWDDPVVPTRAQPRRAAPVTIGDGAVIGPHAAVGPGVTVPVGAVVEPYAVLATPRSVA